jgi:outer membrane protein assembly factor BamB
MTPAEGNLRWIFPSEDETMSTPVIAENQIYTAMTGGPHGITTCINPDNAEVLWSVPRGAATPAVVNGLLYTGSTGTEKGVYCYDVETREEEWHYALNAVPSAVTVHDNSVYFAAGSHAYCLNATTGVEIWVHQNLGPMPSVPVVTNDYAYYSTNNKLFCLNVEDGSEIWSHSLGWSSGRVPVYSNNHIYIIHSSHTLLCVDANGNGDGTTDMIWSFEGEYVLTNPAVAYDHVFFGTRDANPITVEYLYCVDAVGNGDGTTDVLWQNDEAGALAPAVADGKVFAGGSDEKFYCFDAATGERLWRYYDASASSLIRDINPVIGDVQGYGQILACFENGLHFLGSLPPDVPTLDGGPDGEGEVGVPYTFEVHTIDHEGQDVYYLIDWGDGNDSHWIPAANDETVFESYSWSEPGTYEVKARAMDTDEYMSDWSEPMTVNINRLRIDVNGGFGISATITNLGPVSKRVNWTIEVIGGTIPGFHTKRVDQGEDNILIKPGEATTVTTGTFLCLGSIDITVTAKCSGEPVLTEKTEGFVFFFYVFL